MKKIKVAGAALNQTPLDWANNLANIRQAIAEAKACKVNILCLPELCITGYGCEDLFLSEWLPTKAMELLRELVPLSDNIAVTLGLPIRLDKKTYNCVCVVEHGKILGITAKQLLANDGVHYEPRWFSPWPAGKQIEFDFFGEIISLGDIIYTINGINTGFEICEDAWRTGRPAERMVGKNVQLILNPSASHFAFGKTRFREELVRKSSEEFACYYLYANLLGNESGRMIYDGEIFLAGHGQMIAENKRLSYKTVNMLIADIDIDDHNPPIVIPPISEIKNDAFVQAVSLALFDYLRKSRSRGFVLSLSGGADSSTCAVLVAEMIRRSISELGLDIFLQKIGYDHLYESLSLLPKDLLQKKLTNELLTCAYQATDNSSEKTLEAARELAEEIGATFYHWNLEDQLKQNTRTIEQAIGRQLTWEKDDITLQNIQARSRSPLIWMLANINNALLLTTSNRSEGDVGYTTMDGDTSGSIAPIAAVDKHFIIHWLQWAEHTLGYKSLSYVNQLSPTAELRPAEKSQTDEKDLMPYALIVEIERLAILERKSPAEVFDTLKNEEKHSHNELKAYIRKFYTLWSRNQWKRERIAPSFHVDEFNVDPKTWCRFPILSGAYYDELNEMDNSL
ncbi:MAG: NAD(+) synthase [Cyclobacteriaceae bacterium]